MDDILKKFNMKWGGGCINNRDWIFINSIIEKYKIKNVVEFGAGLSTLLFASKVDNIITFETNNKWIEKIDKISGENSKVIKWNGRQLDIEKFKDHKFDLVFVDGPAGGHSREFSTMHASKLGDLVIVHDAHRVWDKKWQEKHLRPIFDLKMISSLCCLWVRRI